MNRSSIVLRLIADLLSSRVSVNVWSEILSASIWFQAFSRTAWAALLNLSTGNCKRSAGNKADGWAFVFVPPGAAHVEVLCRRSGAAMALNDRFKGRFHPAYGRFGAARGWPMGDALQKLCQHALQRTRCHQHSECRQSESGVHVFDRRQPRPRVFADRDRQHALCGEPVSKQALRARPEQARGAGQMDL